MGLAKVRAYAPKLQLYIRRTKQTNSQTELYQCICSLAVCMPNFPGIDTKKLYKKKLYKMVPPTHMLKTEYGENSGVVENKPTLFWNFLGTPRGVSLAGFLLVFLFNRQQFDNWKLTNNQTACFRPEFVYDYENASGLVTADLFVQRDCEWKPELCVHANYQVPRCQY